MKAVVWHGMGDIRLDTVPDKREHQEPTSAIEAHQTFDQRRDGWLKTVLVV